MLRWLLEKLRPASTKSLWSVRVDDREIIVTDGMGSVHRLEISELKKVVVATDDSGPWGDDVVWLLFSEAPDFVSGFPLGVAGEADFLKWLSALPGFREREVSKAMASTSVARFLVWAAE